MRLRALAGRLEPWILVGVALWALLFHLQLPGRQASADDWDALAGALTADARGGDVVVLHPWWTDRARLRLPESLELVGDPRAVGRDLRAHPRIWLVSQPQLPHAGTGEFLETFGVDRIAEGPTRRFGHLELTLYRNDRAEPLRFDAGAALAEARVWIETPGTGRRVPCPRMRAGFRCPASPSLTVSQGWHELDFAPVRCIWMPPPGGAGRLVLDFHSLPPAGTLHLQGGLVGEHAVQRGRGLTPVHFGVQRSDGTPLLTHTLPPGTEGQVHLTHRLGPGDASLQLWSQSDRGERRALCLRMRVFDHLPEHEAAP